MFHLIVNIVNNFPLGGRGSGRWNQGRIDGEFSLIILLVALGALVYAYLRVSLVPRTINFIQLFFSKFDPYFCCIVSKVNLVLNFADVFFGSKIDQCANFIHSPVLAFHVIWC